MNSHDALFLGVDVGTGSARAGLFDAAGTRLAVASHPIKLWKYNGDWAEQSSDDIWEAVGVACRQAVTDAAVDPARVVGIGWDATCSLVVLDGDARPVTVSETGDDARNIIVWMDHRAIQEAEDINAGRFDVLRYVGGTISPEMETPKLRWLKTHLPASWNRAAHFFDLADFLTFQCTKSNTRSLCTTVCKWTYLGHEGRWDADYFRAIGIDDALGPRIGDDIQAQGSSLGPLTADAAAHLGVTTACVCAVGMIDAHAGGLGVLGGALGGKPHPPGPPLLRREGRDGETPSQPSPSAGETPSQPSPSEGEGFGHPSPPPPFRGEGAGGWGLSNLPHALALIGGTSTCHMAVSAQPRFVPGVWGPYYSAMVPGLWLSEGGQSATGALIDFALHTHPAFAELQQIADAAGVSVYDAANAAVQTLALEENVPHPALLTRALHVFDGHLGNRSPLADPRALGVMDGLTLDVSLSHLARVYLATVQATAYGTRAILDSMTDAGYDIRRIYAVGGGTKNQTWLREHADICGRDIVLPAESEATLLGSAMLGAAASRVYGSVTDAMRAMSNTASVVRPNPDLAEYHAEKYAIYRDLYREQVRRRERMARFS